MKRIVTRAGGGLVVLLVLAQFLRPERSNPPVDPARTLSATLEVPAPVQAILDRSCTDCHTHRTVWPWYSRIAPISWLVAHDVEEGREHLDLDEWAGLSPYRQQKKLDEICEEIEEGEMPLPVYLPLHPQARLSEEEVATLCAWATAERDRIRAAGGAERPADEDDDGDEEH